MTLEHIASPDALYTACAHFLPQSCSLHGVCGGCATEDLAWKTVDWAAYAAWKEQPVREALRRIHSDVQPFALKDAHGEGRRRAVLHVRWNAASKKLDIGFMAARSHQLVSLNTCPLFVPQLNAFLHIAPDLLAPLKSMNKPLDVHVTATQAGYDVDIRGAGTLSPVLQQQLARQAETFKLARLSLHGKTLVTYIQPTLNMRGVSVPIAAGAFLQATSLAETMLVDRVCAHLRGAKKVADLFAGCGPFALALAQDAPVHAIESHEPALIALQAAHRSAVQLKPITTETRDLFRRPLLAEELNNYDAVVLDPPRAGASAQVAQIALSKLSRVSMVSCHTATFMRDAQTLLGAGFILEEVHLIDQFRYTQHMELVGLFTRKSQKKRRSFSDARMG
jgi:23S rRNA (uracil1939-C5)-methyltransferase